MKIYFLKVSVANVMSKVSRNNLKNSLKVKI